VLIHQGSRPNQIVLFQCFFGSLKHFSELLIWGLLSIRVRRGNDYFQYVPDPFYELEKGLFSVVGFCPSVGLPYWCNLLKRIYRAAWDREGVPMPETKLITKQHTNDAEKIHLVGQKPPLKPKEVWSIRVRIEISGNKRNLALFNLAIDSKLRSCDLVTLRVGDVSLSRWNCSIQSGGSLIIMLPPGVPDRKRDSNRPDLSPYPRFDSGRSTVNFGRILKEHK
jgi:hypothetical protein